MADDFAFNPPKGKQNYFHVLKHTRGQPGEKDFDQFIGGHPTRHGAQKHADEYNNPAKNSNRDPSDPYSARVVRVQKDKEARKKTKYNDDEEEN